MKNKIIIGLRLNFLIPALVASILALLGIFLPYVSTSAGSSSLLSVMSNSWLMAAAVIFAVAVAVLGIVSFVHPSIRGVRIWAIAAAFQTIVLTILLFASKSILDGSGALSEPFLVKYFGIGYWLSLVTSFVTLIFSMKTAKVNTGYIVLTVLGVIWLFPILWMVLTSLRAEKGYYVGYFIPRGLTFNNYVELFTNPSVLPFGRWWVNTMIVAVCGCLINTMIVLATAFTLSRTRFTGRKNFMKVLMIIGMFPGFMSMLAVYNILKGIGLNQSIVALIVVGAAGAAMGYHVCKGFFDTIPKALDEAAIVDGATRWQIFTRITIPLSKPIAIYTLLTSFLGAWSDYIFPSILFGDKQANYTVAVGLYWMTDFRRIDKYYTQFAAGAMVIAVPIVILFICLQKFYVEGLSGSVKG